MYLDDTEVKTKVLQLLIRDPSMILLLKNKYITDDVWMFCIEREPSLFKYMEDPTLKMCYFAVEQDGHNLKYIKTKFTHIKITKHLASVAISNCPKAIFYVPKGILDDELKESAFIRDPSLMASFNDIRPEFMDKMIILYPSSIKYFKYIDDSKICNLLKDNPNIIVYCNKITDKMRETMEEYHPEFLALIPTEESA